MRDYFGPVSLIIASIHILLLLKFVDCINLVDIVLQVGMVALSVS